MRLFHTLRLLLPLTHRDPKTPFNPTRSSLIDYHIDFNAPRLLQFSLPLL